MADGFTCGIFAENPSWREEACRAIGKKTSTGDVCFYTGVHSGKIISCLDPSGFPAKIQSLVYAANLSDFCVVYADALTARLGEIIVLLDLLGKKNGVLVSNAIDFSSLVKGTGLENWRVCSSFDEAKQDVLAFSAVKKEGLPKGIIDHSFDVKGVGFVLLGVLVRGQIKIHDKLDVFPSGKQVEVRTIQVNDQDVKEAACNERFGLSVKGVQAGDVDRGFVVGKGMHSSQKVSLQLLPSRFLRQAILNGETLHAGCGFQLEPCKVSFEGTEAKAKEQKAAVLEFEKPIAFDSDDLMAVCRFNSQTLRVVAVGKELKTANP